MEPDVTPPFGPEAEMGVPEMVSSSGAPVTWLQFAVATTSVVVTTVGTWVAIVLKRKRPKAGAEDAVYEVNRATIEDQRRQITNLQAQNDALRASRDELSGTLIRTQANSDVAAQHAEAARQLAENNRIELERAQQQLILSQKYIDALERALRALGAPLPERPR